MLRVTAGHDIEYPLEGAGTAVGFATALTGVTTAGAGFDAGALAGFKTRAGAGFVAGAPGAGFPVCGVPTPAKAALLSLVFCSCTEFMVLRVLSMMFGFCAQSPPTIIAIATMPVVSFIAIPTCSPTPASLPVLLRLPRVQDSNRD